MAKLPESYQRFSATYPLLAKAWDLARDAEEEGPLDEATRRLLKLAIAVGAGREGAVRSSVRKALAAGVAPEAIRQTLALAASTIGFPGTVAALAWIGELLPPPKVKATKAKARAVTQKSGRPGARGRA